MSLAPYLPSQRFATIVGSIGLAGLLILGAQYFTNPNSAPAQVASLPTAPIDNNWKASLAEVQATSPGIPPPPSEETVSTLLQAAHSDNLTDTVARSLLINLSDASSQGLGADIPTQDKIVAAAAQAAAPLPAKKIYGSNSLVLVEDTPQSQKVYGNAVMVVLGKHTGATSDATLLAVSLATDNNDPKELVALARIQNDYEGLVTDLAAVPVPKTLAPLQVQALNDLGEIATSVGAMQKLFKDPLLALRALQQYQAMLGEVGRVFTSISQALSKNGILFNKDEPGAAWAVFVSS